MKRILLIGLIAIALVVAAGGIVFNFLGKTGTSSLEAWIGQQLQVIVNSRLNPQLSFSDLDYQYPGTVSLKKLRLVAADPTRPSKTIDIIACDSAVITLAEVPQVGKPIVIEKIILDKPLFSAVAIASDSPKLVGFSDLLRPGAASTQPSTSDTAGRGRLSDHFRMRLVQITDGRIVYDPRIADTQPMELDQINTTLHVEPAEAGWYKLSTAIARKPIFDLSLTGQLDLDSFTAHDMALKLNANLDQEKLSYLPPQLQQFLRQNEVKGALDVVLKGEMQFTDPRSGRLETSIKLNKANVTIAEYRIPIETLDLSARLSDRKLALTGLQISALQGTATIEGSALLNEQLDTDLKMKVSGMMLQDLLAGRKEGEPLKMAGVIKADLQAKAPLHVVIAKAQRHPTALAAVPLPRNWGSANIDMTDGRIVRLPVIHNLVDVIGKATQLLGAPDSNAKPDEKARLVAEFESDHIHIKEFSYVGEYIAATGSGSVGLDRTLNLRLSAGPVQRVEAMLGKQIGGAVSAVTNTLLAYHVTGEISQPKVQPEIAGGAIENLGRGVQGGAGRIGEEFDRLRRGLGDLMKPREGQ